jgi:hypothetical protein
MSKVNTTTAVAAPPIAMPVICAVLSIGLEAALSDMLVLRAVLEGIAETVEDEPEREDVLESEGDAVDAAGFAELGADVGEGVAITMVLICSVEVGVPMVGGRFSIVEDAVVEDPKMVAVSVRAVSG